MNGVADNIKGVDAHYTEFYMQIPEMDMGEDQDWVKRGTGHKYAKSNPVAYQYKTYAELMW